MIQVFQKIHRMIAPDTQGVTQVAHADALRVLPEKVTHGGFRLGDLPWSEIAVARDSHHESKGRHPFKKSAQVIGRHVQYGGKRMERWR